jgi:hypothetical protein
LTYFAPRRTPGAPRDLVKWPFTGERGSLAVVLVPTIVLLFVDLW